jgi:hypothetical protein
MLIGYTGTGVRINCISPGQIDVGVDLHNVSTLLNSILQELTYWEVRYARHDSTIPSCESAIERGKPSLPCYLA